MLSQCLTHTEPGVNITPKNVQERINKSSPKCLLTNVGSSVNSIVLLVFLLFLPQNAGRASLFPAPLPSCPGISFGIFLPCVISPSPSLSCFSLRQRQPVSSPPLRPLPGPASLLLHPEPGAAGAQESSGFSSVQSTRAPRRGARTGPVDGEQQRLCPAGRLPWLVRLPWLADQGHQRTALPDTHSPRARGFRGKIKAKL